MVWKTSVKLGVGMAEGQIDGNKCIFSVGRYREPGNWGGKFGENVKKGDVSIFFVLSSYVLFMLILSPFTIPQFYGDEI